MKDKWILFKDGVIGKVIQEKIGWIKVKYTEYNNGRWYEEHEIDTILTDEEISINLSELGIDGRGVAE